MNQRNTLKFALIVVVPVFIISAIMIFQISNAPEYATLRLMEIYSIIVFDAWAIGLEAIAVFMLIQERKDSGATRAKAENDHNKMAATIYALQSITMLALPQVSLFLNSAVVKHPSEIDYGMPSVAGIISEIFAALHYFMPPSIFAGAYYLIALILLVLALGLLLRQHEARSIARFLSLSGALSEILISLYFFHSPVSWGTAIWPRATIGSFMLTLAFSNILVVYILSPPEPSGRLTCDLNRLGKPAFAFIKMASSAVFLFVGSSVLFWAAYGIIFGLGILTPLIPVSLFVGSFIILLGIYIALHFAENLRVRNLVLISLTYLVIAHLLNLLIFYVLHPNWVSTFWMNLHQINLSDAVLDLAFLIGCLRRK